MEENNSDSIFNYNIQNLDVSQYIALCNSCFQKLWDRFLRLFLSTNSRYKITKIVWNLREQIQNRKQNPYWNGIKSSHCSANVISSIEQTDSTEGELFQCYEIHLDCIYQVHL